MTSQPSSQPTDRALLAGAAIAFALFLIIGFMVSAGQPSGVDAAALGLIGRGGDLIAWILTESGFFATFATLLVLMLVGALVSRKRRYMWRVGFSIVTLLSGWVLSDLLKALFHRARGETWLVRHETSFAYPSGHAVLAVLFWGLWAYFLWKSELPLNVRRMGAAALVIFALAVGWSRLELGAHYLTDVIGGYLLGLAWLGFALFVAKRVRLGLFARP